MIRSALVVFVFGILLQAQLHATIYFGNGHLDGALKSTDLVVVGTLSYLDDHMSGPGMFFGAPYPDVKFKVESVIFGDTSVEGQEIEFPQLALMWPREIVTFSVGSRCILLLEDNGPEPKNLYEYFLFMPWRRYVPTVVPAHRDRFSYLENIPALRQLLAREILDELNQEESLQRQRELIIQVSSIIDPEDCDELIPFLKSKNEWIQRSALAALVYATEDDRYLCMAQYDINQVIESHEPKDVVDDAAFYYCRPYYEVCTCYWFLDLRNDEKGLERHKSLIEQIERLKLIERIGARDYVLFPDNPGSRGGKR